MKNVFANLGFAAALALSGLALSATPAAPVIQKAEAASYTNCYLAMDGARYCYKSSCTFFERLATTGCNSWVRMGNWYA